MAHIGEIIEFKNYFDGGTLKGKIRAVDTDSDIKKDINFTF